MEGNLEERIRHVVAVILGNYIKDPVDLIYTKVLVTSFGLTSDRERAEVAFHAVYLPCGGDVNLEVPEELLENGTDAEILKWWEETRKQKEVVKMAGKRSIKEILKDMRCRGDRVLDHFADELEEAVNREFREYADEVKAYTLTLLEGGDEEETEDETT